MNAVPVPSEVLDAEPKQQIIYDGKISYATVESVSSGVTPKELSWAEFCELFKHPRISKISSTAYSVLTRKAKTIEKDVGGYVGGRFKASERITENLVARSLLTIDIDEYVPPEILQILRELGYCALLHTTRNSTPNALRVRIIMPLSRECSVEEYKRCWAYIADKFEDHLIELDKTSRDPVHIMFWPSVHSDGKYDVRLVDQPWFDVDAALAHNTSQEETKLAVQASMLADPGEKNGIIGQFCKTFTIDDVIKLFLGDVYAPESDGRYTFKAGTGVGGLVVYDGGKYAYSNHNTDPACEQMLNAFDLVRIHRFGDMTPKESTKAMAKFAKHSLDETDIEVSEDIISTKTVDGITQIIQGDKSLIDSIIYDQFALRNVVVGDLPWSKLEERHTFDWQDTDDAQLYRYLEREYGITNEAKLNKAMTCAFMDNAVHPVRQYLESLVWDSKPRMDSLFIDHLGAEDTPYTRAVTRKFLVGAVARIFEPGCQHDYTIVLVGSQGAGKSKILRKLGKSWFSDTLGNLHTERAYEQLIGYWIIEFGELDALRRSEVETVKHFLTKQADVFKKSYARNTHRYPRQCVFFGTTNDPEFLNDPTGNRRFWPIDVKRDFTAELDVDQIWAEAVMRYRTGEKNYFDADEKDMEEVVVEHQMDHMPQSHKYGMIEEFLEMPIPKGWSSWPLSERQFYVKFNKAKELEYSSEQLEIRKAVCTAEIWVELFGGTLDKLMHREALEIKRVLRSLENWQEVKYYNFGPIFGKQRGFVRGKNTGKVAKNKWDLKQS